MNNLNPDFIYLRPVLIVIIFFLVTLLAMVLFRSKKKLLNRFSFFSILFICLVLSSLTIVCEGYIVDAYGLGGDVVSTYLWMAIVALSFICTIVYLKRSNSKPQLGKKQEPGYFKELLLEIRESIIVEVVITIVMAIPRMVIRFFRSVSSW
ncbi:hypothetical protein [Pseudalkalibacillus hwajinpoensis]|uniref:Uncharacterized protein n=1 Tax=Guptibacillus hwajinpoensis TaxID=208199 RepID=A0A4U1MNS9_9BACL|nr:hypothetical protein [Pseudalkalibacillus hwajinpoensis]TKD72302.1 hypothetical protein FBF83_05805 [Pseudalkalibacillus hwajinpoensis]